MNCDVCWLTYSWLSQFWMEKNGAWWCFESRVQFANIPTLSCMNTHMFETNRQSAATLNTPHYQWFYSSSCAPVSLNYRGAHAVCCPDFLFSFLYPVHLLRDAHPVSHELPLISHDEERGKQCCSASCSTCLSTCQHKKLLLLNSCEIQLGNYHLQFLTSCLCLTSNYEHFLVLFKCTFVFSPLRITGLWTNSFPSAGSISGYVGLKKSTSRLSEVLREMNNSQSDIFVLCNL